MSKYSILDSLNVPTDSMSSCLVIVGESDITDKNVFVLPDTRVITMQSAYMASKAFSNVYIYGVKSYKFLIFCIMYQIYKQKNPKSLFILPTLVSKLTRFKINRSVDMNDLTDMELQLKILFT